MIKAPLSYLSPKTAVRPSPIQGRGLFANEPIGKGEIVCVKGGSIFNRQTVAEVSQVLGPAEIQITRDLFIGPITEEEREGSMIFSNHSCDPNIGVQGQIVFVAMRDIAADEELTHDWATTDDDSYQLICNCGADMKRCKWAKSDLMIKYHDEEWGAPNHDDRALFEFLILEGAQAGLSWETILKKRENYRLAFDNFEAGLVAKYDQRKVGKLLADPGIIRNELKIRAAIENAKLFLAVQKEFGSFDRYLWGFVGGRAIRNKWTSPALPANTAESDAMSKDLKRRGFKFVGTTICYAFMQAIGMVNDHEKTCFRYQEVG